MADETKSAEQKQLERLAVEEAQLRVENMKLNTEHLRFEVESKKARRDEIMRAHSIRQQQIESEGARKKGEQAVCAHKKGGFGIFEGDEGKYSVIKHTYPWGETVVMCSRCHKEWRPPHLDLRRSNKPLYKQLLAEYQEALRFPSSNTPSGTMMFNFHGEQPQPLAQTA